MQDKETQKSFPKPPRSFHGDILDPLLVEEDYEETVGMVRRFARDNPSFTEEDLLMRLARNGVVLYGTQSEWDDLFTEMRDQIVAEAAKKRTPVAVTWAVQQLGDMATYTMVETRTASDTPKEVPVPKAIRALTESSSEPARVVGTAPLPGSELRLILDAAADGMMRPIDLTAAVAKQLRIDHDAAAGIIGAALADKLLRKVGNKGITFIVASNGETAQKVLEPVGMSEVHEDEERLLTEDELTMVIAVLDKLSEGHVTTGATIKVLEQQLQSSFGRDHFRKLLRLLESQRLIRIDHEAKYGKARKSPRVHLRGQDTKSRWQANRDGYIARLRNAAIR